MGLFWNLIQQSQIGETRDRTRTLEERIARLEDELLRTQRVQQELLGLLEHKFGEDLNRDGRIG